MAGWCNRIKIDGWRRRTPGVLEGLDEKPGEIINGRKGRDQERTQTEHNSSTPTTHWSGQRSQRPSPNLPRPAPGFFLQFPYVQATPITMEPIVQTVATTAAFDREIFHRRALRATTRGASSHFVGTSIVILSSFAVSTLAMNCGKRFQESRNKLHMN